MEATYAYARHLATEVSPASLAATKIQMYLDLHRDAAASVRDAAARLDQMMTGGDFHEGVAAMTERRPPRFADPPPGASPTGDPPTGDPAERGRRRRRGRRVTGIETDRKRPGTELAAGVVDAGLYASDPHPLFARLRAEAPVAWNEERGFWAVSHTPT